MPFCLVQLLLGACRSLYPNNLNVRKHYHRQKQPIQLTMGIQFDDAEFQLLAQYWKLALGYGGDLSGLAKVTEPNTDKRQFNRMNPRQREKFTAWILQNASDDGVRMLTNGQLILEVVDPDHVSPYHRQTILQFKFSNALTLDLDDSILRGSLDFDAYNGQRKPLGHRIAKCLPSDQLNQLALFLDSEQDINLSLSAQFTQIPKDLRPSSTTINGNDISASTMPTVRAAWTVLKQNCPPDNNGGYSLAQLMVTLITNAVVCIDHWTVHSTSDLKTLQKPLLDQLSTGDLPAYLAALKNGTTDDRHRHQTI